MGEWRELQAAEVPLEAFVQVVGKVNETACSHVKEPTARYGYGYHIGKTILRDSGCARSVKKLNFDSGERRGVCSAGASLSIGPGAHC